MLVDTIFPQASPAFDEIQKQFATDLPYISPTPPYISPISRRHLPPSTRSRSSSRRISPISPLHLPTSPPYLAGISRLRRDPEAVRDGVRLPRRVRQRPGGAGLGLGLGLVRLPNPNPNPAPPGLVRLPNPNPNPAPPGLVRLPNPSPKQVRANLLKAGFTNVLVPVVHAHLCSRRLMVMEEIYPSIPLHTALDQQVARVSKP